MDTLQENPTTPSLDTQATQPKVKVGIYIRVSTEEQKLEGYSLAMQKTYCEEFCISKGYTYKLYVDDGVSSKYGLRRRPALKQLALDMRNGEIQGMVCWRVDRFGRTSNILRSSIDIFIERKWTFETVDEKTDINDLDGLFIFNIRLDLSEREKKLLTKRVNATMKNMVSNEGKTPSRPPFGYHKIKSSDRFEILEHQANKVREIYAKFLGGDTLTQLAALYKMPLNRIRCILSNEAYTGVYTWGKQRFENRHTAIIDTETFENVKKLLDVTSRKQRIRPKRYNEYTPSMFWLGVPE